MHSVNRISELHSEYFLPSVYDMESRQKRIQEAMAEAGLKQIDIAQYIGVSPPTISELIAGKSKSSKHLPKIAKLLGVRALWLDTGKGPRYESSDELNSSESEVLRFWRKFPPSSRRIILAQMQALLDVTGEEG